MANQGEQLIKYYSFEAQTKPSYFGSLWQLVRKIPNLYEENLVLITTPQIFIFMC